MSTITIPRIVYNAGAGAVTINLTVPSPPYNYGSHGIGGHDISAGGIPEAFEIRRDQLLHWTLVFLESEWAAVETWLRLAQQQQFSFTLRPDKNNAAVEYTVYLESPKMGESIRPTRRSDYIGAFDIELTFRRTSATAFNNPIL